MKYVNWVIGSIFLLSGLFAVLENPLSAVFLLACAGLLIPPVRKFAGEKTGITIPLPIRLVAIFALMFVSGFVNIGQFDKQAAKEGGFITVEEYKAASAEGIKTNEDYQKSLAEQKALLEKQKAQEISELEKKLSSTAGFLSKIKILEKLIVLDPSSSIYQVQLAEAEENNRQHQEKIEAGKIAAKEQEARRLAEKQKAIREKTIGVWRDKRPYWNAKYTLLNDGDGFFGELIVEFDDGSEKRDLVEFDKDLNGNLLFKVPENTRGEYYVIKKGMLAIYDEQGYVITLLPDMKISIK